MADALIIIWILAAVYTLISLIKPLPPFRTRKRTVLFGLGGLMVSAFYGTAIIVFSSDFMADAIEKNNARIAATPEVRKEYTIIKPVREDLKKSKPAHAWEKAGFPDQKSYEHAKLIDLPNIKAYSLLSNGYAITSYCEMAARSDAVSRKADKLFGADVVGKKFIKKSAWEELRQVKLVEGFRKEWGITQLEQYGLEINGGWLIRCDAKALGWKVARSEDIERVSPEQVAIVSGAIELYYITQLNTPGGHFANSRYSVADCRKHKVRRSWIIGCRLRSVSAETRHFYFVAARTGPNKFIAASLYPLQYLEDKKSPVLYTPGGEVVYLGRTVYHRLNPASPTFDLKEIEKAFGVSK